MAIAQVIKYEGDNKTFIWKHPCEDFNSFTQLIVHQSQEAIFMLNGQILDIFGAGRFTLETQNIPKISKALNRVTGKDNAFHCEVYFVNKTEQLAIKWGTDSKVQYIEPTYNFPLSIGVSGEMFLSVSNSKKLLLKLVGTEKVLTQEMLVHSFRALLMMKVKSYLANIIKEKKINIFEIDSHLSEISYALLILLMSDFENYGMKLVDFFIMNVVKPDGEANYEKFKNIYFRQYSDVAEAKLRQTVDVINAQTQAQKDIITSKAQATKRQQEGYTYAMERGFDVAEKIASNEAIGQMTNLGVGLGTMAGVGGSVAGIMTDSISQTKQNVLNKCPQCGTTLVNGACFCHMCGYKIQSPTYKICPKCGQKNINGNFCAFCGEKL